MRSSLLGRWSLWGRSSCRRTTRRTSSACWASSDTWVEPPVERSRRAGTIRAAAKSGGQRPGAESGGHRTGGRISRPLLVVVLSVVLGPERAARPQGHHRHRQSQRETSHLPPPSTSGQGPVYGIIHLPFRNCKYGFLPFPKGLPRSIKPQCRRKESAKECETAGGDAVYPPDTVRGLF